MTSTVLTQLLVLLSFSVLVVAAFRRLNLPPILGYLAVGLLLGRTALNLAPAEPIASVLAELGVVFLVFTLGLEFSFPRMLVMRREVLGLGGGQMLASTAVIATVFRLLGVDWLPSIVLGGALAMSSTAMVIRQLTEQLELNQTHSRYVVGILLFQDLAFAPLLALEDVLQGHAAFTTTSIASTLVRGAVALLVVLAAGQYLLRPLFHEIGRARSTELFTLAVLLVALASAWATHAVGLSMALGAFLAGMMLAETEYRHQIESVIRPFRDILLGLFFITVGTLLDLHIVFAHFWLVLSILCILVLIKASIVVLLVRRLHSSWYIPLRAGIVIAQGGEFGFALLTLMLYDNVLESSWLQPLLAATVLSMAGGALLIRHNAQLAAKLLHQPNRARNELELELAATHSTAKRDHVIVCGFGRVGQNVARVLDKEGIEYIALDLDPNRVREARQAGDPVVFGDSAEPEVLSSLGLEHCKVLVISFADPNIALRIIHSVRELRKDVPILVRTQDDTKLDQLQRAGATEVVPETLEASLMLVSHLLLLLKVPLARVVQTVDDIRVNRYSMLRHIFRRSDARPIDATHTLREELRSLVLPRGAHAAGKTIGQLNLNDIDVSITAIRRDGIVGRQPASDTLLRAGDVVVLYGTPESLEHGEIRLLTG
jgi:monovalent cation:H+ antiporter-2, CPA2 family